MVEMGIRWQEWTVVHISMFVTFILTALICNILNLAIYLVIRPLNLEQYRTLSQCLLWVINSQLMILGTHYSGSKVNVCADPEVVKTIGDHHGIFLVNHHYEVDWLVTWVVADAYSQLSRGKVIAKKMLKYVPTVGFSWALNDYIFLDRDWDKDKTTLTESMDVLASYSKPFWLLLYPEGTRLSPKKLEEGQEFSRQRGLPVLQHQLYPRTKGFARIMETLDTSRVEYVYDITMMINTEEGAKGTITNALMGRKMVADLYVRRIHTKDISKDPEEASKFLVDLCVSKDHLIDSYKRSGMKSFTSHLPEGVSFPDYRPVRMTKRWFPILTSLMLNLIVSPCVMYCLARMVLSGSLVLGAIATLFLVGIFLIMKKFLNLSQIEPTHASKKKK